MWWRKQRNQNLVEKWFPIFNEKNTPDRLSYSRSVMEQADMYEVYIRDGDKKRGYLFEKMEGNELFVRQYNAEHDSYRDNVRLTMSEVSPEHVNGAHYYRGYQIAFDGLAQLESRDRLKLLDDINRDEVQDKLQQRLYNSQEPRVKDRMRVLEVAIRLYISNGHPFGISRIATQIFSHRWEDHPQKEMIKRELQLALDSFVVGGELTMVNVNGYIPTGKAFKTQAEYELQNLRHNENAKLQKGTKRATAFAAWAAFFSALASFITLFLAK